MSQNSTKGDPLGRQVVEYLKRESVNRPSSAPSLNPPLHCSIRTRKKWPMRWGLNVLNARLPRFFIDATWRMFLKKWNYFSSYKYKKVRVCKLYIVSRMEPMPHSREKKGDCSSCWFVLDSGVANEPQPLACHIVPCVPQFFPVATTLKQVEL